MRVLMAVLLLSAGALAKSEDRELPQFNAVHVSSGMHATIAIGPKKPVHLEADAETLARIETAVEDGELSVRFKTGAAHDESEVSIAIQTPELRAVGASGGSVVKAEMTRADRSELHASGGSEIHARGVDAGKLELHGSGGAVLTVAGKADSLELRLSGGSRLHGRDLAVKDLEVQGSGGSQADLRASGKIRGGLSGGSQLHASGGGQAKVSTSGGSEVDVEN